MRKVAMVVVSFVMVFAIAAPITGQVCGDFNGNGNIDITEVVAYINYLFQSGAPPVNYGDADIDDHQNVTTRDLFFIVANQFIGGMLSCPASQARLHDLAIVDDSTYLHTWESFLPHASILTPGDSTYVIHIQLTTNDTLECGSFPLSVRVGGEIPEILRATASTACPDGGNCQSYAQIDDVNAVVAAGTLRFNTDGHIVPGTHDIVDIEIKIPPLSATWRPITVALDSMPPVQNGLYAHQPWVTSPDDPADIWRPVVYAFPCLGQIRGNINYDTADGIDISDLTFLVGYMFKDNLLRPPKCFEEVDVDASLGLDIADLTYMVNYMFKEGPDPERCPQFDS